MRGKTPPRFLVTMVETLRALASSCAKPLQVLSRSWELCNRGLSWNFSLARRSHVNVIVGRVIRMIRQMLESLLGREHIF